MAPAPPQGALLFVVAPSLRVGALAVPTRAHSRRSSAPHAWLALEVKTPASKEERGGAANARSRTTPRSQLRSIDVRVTRKPTLVDA